MAAAIAIGGLVIITAKLVSTVVNLGKKAAESFAEFVKGSVEVSKNLEVLERQFTGLLGGSEELARSFRDNLLDLSVIVGQDLTQDFSRLLVPLTSNQAQIEEFAKTMSALSVSIPATEFERVVSVVRQMISGRFRGAKDTLGFTDAEIKRVQDFQKEMGVTAGTLEGLGILLDRLGVSFDGVSDTLAIAEGRMKAFRVQIEEALAEPIKDELGEIFSRLTDFIDENKTEILDFFNFVGGGLSQLIGEIGDFATEFIESFSEEDVDDLKLSFGELQESVLDFLGTIREISGEDFSTVKNALTGIIDFLEKIVSTGDTVISTFASISDVVNFEADIADLEKLGNAVNHLFSASLPGTMRGFRSRWSEFWEVLGVDANESFFKSVFNDEFQDRLGERLADRLNLSDDPNVVQTAEAAGEAIGLAFLDAFYVATGIDVAKLFGGSTKEFLEGAKLDQFDEIISPEIKFLDRAPVLQDEHIDLQLEYNAALTDFNNIAPAAADAQEEINEAQAALALEQTQRFLRTQTEFSRRVLKLENDLSRQREDIHRKFGERINELNIDWQNSLLELEITFDRKEEDILRDFNDKTEDLARTSTDKKIDIEKKFRDRLREIRAKFDFDAQEAIRMNDAVALLRIRRRMAFELQQAKDRKDDDIEQANEQEERKTRDLNIWLERQRRDAEIAEDRKLEDLIASDMQKRAELGRQYKFELEQQRINEQRKRDDLAQWREWEDEDTQTWFDQQNEKLGLRLQEQYDIIANAKEAQLRLARAYNRLISQALAVQIPTGLLTRDSGLNPLQLASGFGTGVRIRDISPVQLTPGGRQLGGFQTPGGRPTLVGERRPEPFYPTQAGVISPHVPLMMSTGIGSGGASIDNSRNVSADISTLDPSQVSPIQQTIIKSIFMDQMLALTFGE